MPRTKLINLRKNRNLTQEQVAKLLNIKRSAYSSYETGTREPKLEIVIALKKLFNTKDDTVFLVDKDTKSNI